VRREVLRSSLAIEATLGGSKEERNSNKIGMGHHGMKVSEVFICFV